MMHKSINYVTSCLPFFRELGIGIVSYSPLGRGFFASGPKLVENLDNNDFRKASAEAFWMTCLIDEPYITCG